MLIGGSRSSGSIPSQRSDAARLDSITFQSPSTIRRRVRLVRVQQPAQRLPQGLHDLAVIRLLQVGRSEAAGEQQAVPLGDREVEVLREVDEELAARARTTRLDEADVLRGEVRVQRQLHLRQPPLGAPEADELTDGLRLLLGLDGHAANASARPRSAPSPRMCNAERSFCTSEVIDPRTFLGSLPP